MKYLDCTFCARDPQCILSGSLREHLSCAGLHHFTLPPAVAPDPHPHLLVFFEFLLFVFNESHPGGC